MLNLYTPPSPSEEGVIIISILQRLGQAKCLSKVTQQGNNEATLPIQAT